jgi:23S rRNA (uracil1939-C5)-methyltransferase
MHGNEELRELVIEKIIAGGEGLGRAASGADAGKAVFVPLVVRGERVVAKIVARRNGYERADLVEVLDRSPDRTEPECPLYGICGGCSLQHMRYEEQLRSKLALVRESFERTGKIRPDQMPNASISIVPGSPYGYRNRFQFHRALNGHLGFKEQGSNEIVPVNSCPVAHPSVNEFLKRQNGKSGNVPTADRFAVIGTDEGLCVEGRDREFFSVILNKRVKLSPSVFFQSNISMLERLIPYVLGNIPSGNVADLYAGVGLFSVFLRDRVSRLHVVEENPAAAECARENVSGGSVAEERGSGNTGAAVRIRSQRVESWLKGAGARERLEAVIVDPPRTGLSAEVRSLLIRRRVPEIRYVSCNPVTLARDTAEFLRAGYRSGPCMLFDFYPQTAHVEAFLILTREVGSSP